MNPRDFLKLAATLAAGATPGESRSSISRAYYAVFNVGVELLRPIVPIATGAQAHGEVQKCFMNCGETEIEEVASDLSDLHSRRIQADYRMDKPGPENPRTARAAVQEAHGMITTLDRVFTSASRPKIAAAIQAYWKNVLRRPL